jgi:hypothetical protein
MQLDSVGDGKTVPAKRNIFVVGDSFMGAGAECGRQRQSNLSLESIAGDIAHLTTDRVEALPFALADLDGQQLQKMPVSVSRAGACPLGPVEKSTGYVKPNRSCARRCSC